MHEPRPYGRFVHDGDLSAADAAAVAKLTKSLTNFKQVSELDSLRWNRTLPSGRSAFVKDMGGIFKVVVFEGEEPEPDWPTDGRAQLYIPMLFSGVVTGPTFREKQGVGLRLTEQTRKRLAGYATAKLPGADQELQRFRIGYHQGVQEFEPKDPGEISHSQYKLQRPTWYSGAMAEVVQLVGGYGRQDFEKLPATQIEQAQFNLPKKVRQEILREVGDLLLPGYLGFPPKDGQLRFDYKCNKTHAVAFDTNKKPWLLRISSLGVFAMPLPVIPATTTEAFRRYVGNAGDDELSLALDRFGALPSGECFPEDAKDFEAWRRAGVIIKVCTTADFYSHIAYAQTCGWSLSTSGREGVNTCYDYDREEGLAYGLTYMLHLSLAAVAHSGMLPPDKTKLDEQDIKVVSDYLNVQYKNIGPNGARSLSIRYKIRRVGLLDVLKRARLARTRIDVEYWENLELEPIATHTGHVGISSRGWLYDGAKANAQPQIKFPFVEMAGCLSFDFSPLENGKNKSNYPRCDTIMFGYYVGEQLKVVKYFRDDRSKPPIVEDDFTECMTVGAWTRTEKTTATLQGAFYTTDFDAREEVPAQETVTNIVGKDKGYDSQPRFKFDALFWKPGTLTRSRYFSHETVVTRSQGMGLNAAACIPFLCRNAVEYGHQKWITQQQVSKSGALDSIEDPTSYRFWTYDFVMHWAGGLEVQKGSPYPKNGNPVWVEIENYVPSGCSDFADQGSWIPGLPADYTWLIHPIASEWKLIGGGGAPPYQPHSSTSSVGSKESGRHELSILEDGEVIKNERPESTFFLPSPGESGDIFYTDATRNLFGTSKYANTFYRVGEGRRMHWGYSRIADNSSAHNFIGVINE